MSLLSARRRRRRRLAALATLPLLVGVVWSGCGDDSPGAAGGDGGTPADAGRDRGASLCERGVAVNACGSCGPLDHDVGDPCTVEGEPPEGLCARGTWACDPDAEGEVLCQPDVPEFEACDEVDNDCDGLVDEDFDLEHSTLHCGACNHACEYEHGVGGCEAGFCVLAACEPGWADDDDDPDTGCEAPCTADGSDIDGCDGVDNDCDGLVDEDYVPTECGAGACRSTGFCDHGVETPCTPLDPPTDVETDCDGVDDNCDGQIDEGIALECDNSCGNGFFVCNEGEFPACSGVSEEGDVCIDIQFFCETIPVELTLPLPTPDEELGVDVAFLFDRSGSFGDDLTTFQAQATSITDALSVDLSELAVGLGSFIDAPCAGFGGVNDFGYELNLGLTTDLTQLESTLLGLDIRSGADGPESQLEGMYQILTGEGLTVTRGDASCAGVADIPATDMGWRERSLSFLFVSTDANFHHPGDVGYPYPHADGHVIAAANERGTRVYFLQAGGIADPDTATISASTGGEVFNLSSDSAEIADAVTQAVLDALTRTEIELVPERDVLGFVTDIEPDRLTGLDLLTNRQMTLTVTLLSTVDPTGEEETYSFDLVFFVNGGEIARRPVVITIPAEDPKDCSNRPPIIRNFGVPYQVGAGDSAILSLDIEEPDGNPVFYDWQATAGSIPEPGIRDAVFNAPAVPGLVDVSVTVSDVEDNADSAIRTVHVMGGSCATGERLQLGYTEGRMVMAGELEQSVATSSCGGAGSEGVVVLEVHKGGSYRFTMDTGTGWNLHLRGRDCATEIACAVGSELEVDLEEGSYFLFVDTESGTGGSYLLYAERVDDDAATE